MHKVNEGPANKSYGLQVAELAGVPQGVITIAKQKLLELEQPQRQEIRPLSKLAAGKEVYRTLRATHLISK